MMSPSAVPTGQALPGGLFQRAPQRLDPLISIAHGGKLMAQNFQDRLGGCAPNYFLVGDQGQLVGPFAFGNDG